MNRVSSTRDALYYLAFARSAPELGREEEAELCRLWKVAGDRRAANTLARAHMRNVVAIAMKYRHYGVPVGELVAEGNVGVVQALAKFQPERGVRFGTYASYWVRAQMLSHVIKSYSSVGGSDGPMRSQVFFKLRRERVRVANQFGTGDVADQALAERLGVSVDRVRGMLQRLDGRDVSLDAKVAADSGKLLDRMPAPDDQEQELFARQVGGSLSGALRDAVSRLDPRERYIVEQRLMADSSEELSLAQIGRALGVSRERARQLEGRAKRKLCRLITEDGNPVVREWVETQLPAVPPSPPRVVRRRAPRKRGQKKLVEVAGASSLLGAAPSSHRLITPGAEYAKSGRGGRIRTGDPLTPSQVR
jgi:RNA polymerase sigma-32 factor